MIMEEASIYIAYAVNFRIIQAMFSAVRFIVSSPS